MEVGVRELRNNLSRYLEKVQGGEEVVITDRGRAIARVTRVGAERAIDRLIADGVITPARHPKRKVGKPITASGPVSDLVADQRR